MDNPLSNSAQNMFSLSKDALLKLYDKKRKKEKTAEDEEDLGSPITAITSLIGEDLLLGFFDHYLQEKTSGDGIIWDPRHMYKCKGPGNKGSRLDAWIKTKKGKLYQAEAKNWCASAIGGVEVEDDCETNAEKTKSKRKTYTWSEAARHNRDRYLAHKDCIKPVWKVLVETQIPDEFSGTHPERLLLFWSPVAPFEGAPKDTLEPFFSVKTAEFAESIEKAGLDLPAPYAKEVHIFSASNYLRQTSAPSEFQICMPRVRERLDELRKLGFPMKL